jgi:hypothetical protein
MRTRLNAETEAALAPIRDEETHPARPDDAPVPDQAPDLLGALQRAVEAARAERRGGAA